MGIEQDKQSRKHGIGKYRRYKKYRKTGKKLPQG